MLARGLGEFENYGSFEAAVVNVPKEHAPVKKKYSRANDEPF